MKERIERRKKELASKKAQEEEDQMKKIHGRGKGLRGSLLRHEGTYSGP